MGSDFIDTGWSKDLETGIEVLDEQHHKYFDLLGDHLAKVAESSTTTEKLLDIAETFNFLRQYAKEHFSTEEEVMQKSGYPDSELHIEEHQYFLKHVEELYDLMRTQGYSPKLAREINYYTIEWFIEHIRITDMKLVNFLEQKSTEDKEIKPFLKIIYQSLFGKT